MDEYHGTQVADPYRWLEDSDTPESRTWIEAQNRLTFGFLESIPSREHLLNRLTELWDYPKEGAPVRRSGRYFQFRNSGLQNQNVLYVMDSVDGDARVLLDPNALSVDGTVALTQWAVSPDGTLLAYATSESGSDWLTWRVRTIESGEDLPDVLQWSKFSEAAWLKDGSGFYYSRYKQPEEGAEITELNQYQKLYFHRIGDAQEDDDLVYQRPDEKQWGFAAEVSDDGNYLVIHVWQGTDTRNRVFYQDLDSNADFVELIQELEAEYIFLGNDGPVFYFRSDSNAPLGCVLATASSNPSDRKTLIPEQQDALQHMIMVNDEFVGLYLHDATHQIARFSLSGKSLGTIDLPAIGSIPSTLNDFELSGRRDHDELFFSFWSFLHPNTPYRFDFQTGEAKPMSAPPIDFDMSGYVTRPVFVRSKDRTRLSLFLTHRSDLQADGTNPTLLYGYGGFNVSLTPRFSVSNLVWLEHGGVLA